VEIRCLPWAEAGPGAATTWATLRASNPSLRSPYFAWEFVDRVAAVQGNVEVAVLTQAARPVGYFPFQRVSARQAQPVGSPLNDYQGLVAGPGLAFDPRRLLETCDLDRFEFDHLVVEQASWAPYHHVHARSPYLDLSAGLETWLQERQRAGHSGFQRLKKVRRGFARSHGRLRFELDVREERVLDQLLALKSAQYRQTLGPERDLFANPSMAAIVREIFRLRSPSLCGTLSALWVGEELAAAHFGMRSGGVLHWWFPAFAPALSKYSPGALLLMDVTEAAAGAGIVLIDFGKGDEPYKLRWATGAFEVAQGWVDVKEEEITRCAHAKP
jgi:CelD/BcsL family acetyltransferase involved in cellulose biosynthesis